jgi:hypothetical protein
MRDYLLVSTKPRGRDFIDLEGRRFGRLVVLGYLPRQDGDLHIHWICRCDCGALTKPTTNKLRQQSTISCGCYAREERRKRGFHYGRNTKLIPEYGIYSKMRGRCLNQNDAGYPDYGGRGIKICERWLHGNGSFRGFECFLQDMGARPSRKHSLDRINNDGNYEPNNCRWTTSKYQARNRRSNRYVLVGCERMALSEACERLGLDFDVMNDRMKRGWSFERARTQIIRGRQ